MKLIINGIIHTMEGNTINNGYVAMENGKIIEVGDMESLKLSCDKVYDANGMYVLPGLVDPHSHIGMWEDSLGFEGADGNEETDPITPHLRAIDAINPFDVTFKEALREGVTTSVVGPGSANVIGGQFAAIKMSGKCIDDMIIREPVAIKVALGENPKTTYHSKNQAPTTRMSTAALLRETLYKAKEYLDNIKDYELDSEENDKPEYDIKLEAILPVIKKEIPLKVHAHRADDIFTAIRIAKEFDIRITLDHATEAHLICDKLIGLDYPIILGPSLIDRSKPELKNLTFEAGSILERAGIKVAILTDHPETPAKYLTLCAALYVKEGMSVQAALEAITITAARSVGIDDRVGSIKAGKDADIVVFDGHPLDYMSHVKYVFIDGKEIILV